MIKVAASWSGGKDSCLACYEAIREGYEVSYLVNTISREFRRVRFHGTEAGLVQKQAQAVGIPLLQKETSGDDYERDFKEAIRSVIQEGVRGVAFGDIRLDRNRQWAEKICKELGVRAIEPLWGRSSAQVLRSFVEAGFEATVVCTQANLLGEEWVGRKLDKEFIEELVGRKEIDACGENGEYHTLVTDGPLFKKRIEICQSRKLMRNGYWFLDIRTYRLVGKAHSASGR